MHLDEVMARVAFRQWTLSPWARTRWVGLLSGQHLQVIADSGDVIGTRTRLESPLRRL